MTGRWGGNRVCGVPASSVTCWRAKCQTSSCQAHSGGAVPALRGAPTCDRRGCASSPSLPPPSSLTVRLGFPVTNFSNPSKYGRSSIFGQTLQTLSEIPRAGAPTPQPVHPQRLPPVGLNVCRGCTDGARVVCSYFSAALWRRNSITHDSAVRKGSQTDLEHVLCNIQVSVSRGGTSSFSWAPYGRRSAVKSLGVSDNRYGHPSKLYMAA